MATTACRLMRSLHSLHNVSMSETSDLRTRRRRQTTLEIHEAARSLARAHGFDRITIEQISAEAGVSQRTFFNYFPTKEAAVAYAPLGISDEIAADFIARGKARKSVVLTEAIAMATEHLGEHAPVRQHFEDIMLIARQHPSVLAAMLSTLDEFHASLATLVAQRLGLDAEDDVPQITAGLVLSIVRAGLDMWIRATPTAHDTPVPYVTRAASLARSFFEPTTAREPGRPRRPPTQQSAQRKSLPR